MKEGAKAVPGIRRWLFPTRSHLHSSGRLAFGLIANVVLAIYVMQRRDHLNDIGDYQYVQLNMIWLFMVGVIPIATLIGVLPALMSKRPIHKLLALGLSAFPAYLTLVEWHQHLMNAIEGRYS